MKGTPVLWLADACRQAGCSVTETPGWQTRGRDSEWHGENLKGVVLHHTAGTSVAGDIAWVTSGGAYAPWAQIVIGPDGMVYIIAAGRASHAGVGGPWRSVPKDQANAWMIGIEVSNAGLPSTPWPAAQQEAAVKATRGILARMGLDSTNVIGHKEWSPTRKVDPLQDMMAFRAQVAGYPPPNQQPVPPPPVPVLPTVSLSEVRTAATRDPARPTGGITPGARDDVILVERALVAKGMLEARWVDGSFGTKTRTAYAAWQKKVPVPGPYDGIPGIQSLTALGSQTNLFKVGA